MGVIVEKEKFKGATFVQETDPSNTCTPVDGDTWINPSDGTMFVWLNSEWVQPVD